MIILDPSRIYPDLEKLTQIESEARSILRSVIFCKRTSSSKLLDSFLSSTNSLAELLSIKNAQMEAQDEAEAEIYLQNLRRSMIFVVNEIKDGESFSSMVQLFQLFRLISPESHGEHPNRFRDKLVQVGSHVCPAPELVPNLVRNLVLNMETIDNVLIRAIYFHHELIRIHPLADGNGRVIRIAKNWMLMYAFYPPIFINDEIEKRAYINALRNSFDSLNRNGGLWNENTSHFFDQELERLSNSLAYVRSRLND